jgi:hypothetical protein
LVLHGALLGLLAARDVERTIAAIDLETVVLVRSGAVEGHRTLPSLVEMIGKSAA